MMDRTILALASAPKAQATRLYSAKRVGNPVAQGIRWRLLVVADFHWL